MIRSPYACIITSTVNITFSLERKGQITITRARDLQLPWCIIQRNKILVDGKKGVIVKWRKKKKIHILLIPSACDDKELEMIIKLPSSKITCSYFKHKCPI